MNKILKMPKEKRIWIDGKCFPVFDSTKDATIDPNYRALCNIDHEANGSYMSRFCLPLFYHQQIKNSFNFKLTDFQQDTKTRIQIGNPNRNSIIIECNTADQVLIARNELHSMLWNIRDKSKALQFLSIPVLSEEVKRNFHTFQKDILKMGNINGLHESIFQQSEKLHLTVTVFCLLDDTEIAQAISVLNDYKHNVLEPMLQGTNALKVNLKGIDCMNGNLNRVHVLYAKPRIVNETENVDLQQLVNGIQGHFYDAGLGVRYTENVKLHVTLMNTKYRKLNTVPTKKPARWHMRKEPFDATQIMKKYKDFDFGMADLSSIRLSLISSIGEDGFYKNLSMICL